MYLFCIKILFFLEFWLLFSRVAPDLQFVTMNCLSTHQNPDRDLWNDGFSSLPEVLYS